MFKGLQTSLFGLATLLGVVVSQGVLAKGAELKFESAVKAVSQTDVSEGTVTVVINGFDVDLVVNGDTEIHAEGNEVTLDELNIGDAVRVTAFFGEEGIVAEEILVLQMRGEQFRLRGHITEVESDALEIDGEFLTRLQLLGVDVFVGSETRITQRGVGFGNQVPVENLTAGLLVDMHGHFDEQLMARRIHIGSRQLGEIELDGEVLNSSEDGFTLRLENGVEVVVIIDENTVVGGDIEDGALVEVEGMLNEELAIVATEVVVDTDGDGDADDNNFRRPFVNIPDAFKSRFSTTLVPVDEASSMEGTASLKFPPGKKKMKIQVSGADANVEMSVHLLLGAVVIDLGTVMADGDGNIDTEVDLTAAVLTQQLPDEIVPGMVRMIELSVEGTVVLRGTFGG